MPKEVIIPALGESITSGILSSWKVDEGSYVELDQPIYELETDKITQEGLADASGTIKFLAQEGDEVEIGATIATIDESSDSPTGSATNSTKEDKDTEKTQTSLETATEPDEDMQETVAVEEKTSPSTESPSQPKSAVESTTYSPAVRKLLEETGINPSSIKGTGKDGRLTKADVLKAQSQEKTDTAPQKSCEYALPCRCFKTELR